MIIETLKKNKVFSALTERELKDVASYFEAAAFNKGKTIFIEDDPSDWFYIVAEGRVKVVKHSIKGKDVILEIISPGEVFGGVAVLDRRPFPASAEAMETVKVIRISRKNLFAVMESYPGLSLSLVTYFSNRLRNAHDTLRDIATERVEIRIASLLLKLSEKAAVEKDGFRKIDIPMTRQEIAEMVGTTVETAIRTMSKFQKEGMIRTSGGRIFVANAPLRVFLQS
ncbi:MAG: Crp/Fnr family transcriptional regulator [Nitrospirae bacterium]|nr:Crp/Fnr family transcriptional regulator [Nitrospirota bacterium]